MPIFREKLDIPECTCQTKRLIVDNILDYCT